MVSEKPTRNVMDIIRKSNHRSFVPCFNFITNAGGYNKQVNGSKEIKRQ